MVSDFGFSRASKWLESCLESHKSCKVIPKIFTPRRLLQIIPLDSSPGLLAQRSTKILLVERQEPPRSIKYAALSYCWGQDTKGIVTTTKSNLKAHHRGIVVGTLPQTIQDAVLVCRGLKIQFLWVDSLCIVQDDSDDWQVESSNMQYVYTNSLLTLAIHSASSCKKGFLSGQEYGKLSWQSSFSAQYSPSLLTSEIQSRPAAQPSSLIAKFHIRQARVGDEATSASPLMQRAWTLQEGIFPRRILHFRGTELVWECGEHHFCECGHIDSDGKPSDFSTMTKSKLAANIFTSGLKYDGWTKLISEYSDRAITHGSDKLVAISGLAQSLDFVFPNSANSHPLDIESAPNSPSHLGSVYLAGLFRPRLLHHLLWFGTDDICYEVNGKWKWRSRSQPYRAPTWSWGIV